MQYAIEKQFSYKTVQNMEEVQNIENVEIIEKDVVNNIKET